MKHRLLTILLVSLCVPGPAQALEPEPDLVSLAKRADQLSQDSVEITRDILLLEEALIPNRQRVAIFVTTTRGSALQVQTVDVRMNGRALVRKEFSQAQADALREGGAYRLRTSAMNPGSHVLEAAVKARDAEGSLHEFQQKMSFRAGQSARTLEIQLVGRDAARAELLLHEW
jgi:hypothetical protein